MGSIKKINNLVLKRSLITCWTQIKTQILTKKKKKMFKLTCLCILQYI